MSNVNKFIIMNFKTKGSLDSQGVKEMLRNFLPVGSDSATGLEKQIHCIESIYNLFLFLLKFKNELNGFVLFIFRHTLIAFGRW